MNRPNILVVAAILALAGWVMYVFEGVIPEFVGSIAAPGLLGALLLWRYGALAQRAEKTGEFPKTALAIIVVSVLAAVAMLASGPNSMPEGDFQSRMRATGALLMMIQAAGLVVSIL